MHGTEGSRATCILEKENLLRRGEQSQALFLAPQHYLLLLLLAHPYATACYMRSCTTCLAMRDQVGQVSSEAYFPMSEGKDHSFVHSTALLLGSFSLS